MNSKISFYSKDTEQKLKTNRFRKDKQSFFQQFEKMRQRQRRIHKSSKNKNQSLSQRVMVRSQDERQMLSYLKIPTLPSIQLKSNKMQTKQHFIISPTLVSQGPLEKILANQSKYTKKYFKKLHSFSHRHKQQQLQRIFPTVKIAGLTVKSILKDQQLIIRAVDSSGKQKYLKYPYNKYAGDIQNNYQEFVKIKIQLHTNYDQ